MESTQEQWQRRDEEHRMQLTISVLLSANSRALTSAEVLFLASELGLSARDVVTGVAPAKAAPVHSSAI